MVKGYENKRIIIKCFVLFLWWLFQFLLFLLFRMVLLVLSLRLFYPGFLLFLLLFFFGVMSMMCALNILVHCIISDFACYVDMYFYWCRLSYQTVSSFIFRTFMTSRGLFDCFRFVPGVLSTVCCEVYS